MVRRRIGRCLQVAVLTAAIIAGLTFFNMGLFRKAELRTLDMFYRMRGSAVPSSNIVIAAIDDESIEKLGAWPWKRKVLSDLVSKLRDMGAAIIAIDTTFAHDVVGGDRHLLAQVGEKRDTVLGYAFYQDKEDIPLDRRAWATGEDAYDILAGQMIASTVMPSTELISMAGVKALPEGHRLKGGILAFTNLLLKQGEPCLTVPLVARYRNLLLPSLGLAVAGRFEHFTPLVRRDASGNLTAVSIGRRTIPIDDAGRMFLNLVGPSVAYKYVSVVDILNGSIESTVVKNRVVMVGPTYTGPEPRAWTSFGKDIPAIEIWANAVDNMVFGKPLTSVVSSKAVSISMVFILALLLGVLMPLVRSVHSILIAAGVCIAVLFDGYLFFTRVGVWFPVAMPLASVLMIAIVVLIYRFFTEERARRRMHARFGSSLKRQIIDDLANKPREVPHVGERRHLTVLVLGIRNFAAIFDALTPEKMVEFMQEYIAVVSAPLLEHEAFISSADNDKLIAVFGAPQKRADHALRACKAALEIRRAVVKNQAVWKERYVLATLRIGIGIHTGPLVIGEMDERGRDRFTALGPTIHLSERFSSLDRVYHTTIIAGSETVRSAKEWCAFRPLDMVRLPSMRQPVEIHELLGTKKVVVPHLEVYRQAYDAYRRKNFELALTLIENVLSKLPHDGPSQLIRARAKRLMEHPPGPSWDGIWMIQE